METIKDLKEAIEKGLGFPKHVEDSVKLYIKQKFEIAYKECDTKEECESLHILFESIVNG